MLTTTAPIVSPAELDRLHFSMDANPGSVVVVAKARGERGARFITIGDQNAYACVGRASVFEVGSVTKTLTGLLLADMVRTGDVTLDDPLDAYLPAGIHAPRYGAARAITLRDLATHRSGLPDIPPQHSLDASWYTTFGENDLFAFLSTYRPSHAPGEAYEYSNIGVGLLAIALARRAHTGYAELIRERILEPLGMRDTTIPRRTPPAPRSSRGTTSSGTRRRRGAPTRWPAPSPPGRRQRTSSGSCPRVCRTRRGRSPRTAASR